LPLTGGRATARSISSSFSTATAQPDPPCSATLAQLPSFVESSCCKYMFLVFQMFQRYVVSLSDVCCKSRSGCCICCNSSTRMLQRSVTNVSFVFTDVCCKCVYLDVAYVSHICYICFIWMLRMFAKVFKCFLVCLFQVFQKHVASVCFKCFSCFRHMLQVFYLNVAYVASICSKCFIYFIRTLQQVLHVASVS
jgi:hypothetical protein